jgi:hypothetical protein
MNIPSPILRIAGLTTAVLGLSAAAAPLSAAVIPNVTYTYSKAPSTSYPDNDLTKLTNGVRVTPAFNSTGFSTFVAGWIQNPANVDAPHPAITFSLGDLYHLTEVAISYAIWPGAGVRAPGEVRVSFSSDGANFTGEQVFTGFDGSDHGDGYAVFSRILPVNLTGNTASSVRLDFRQGPGEGWGLNRSSWHMLDEVTFTGTVVPEPSTVALLSGLIALGAAGFIRRRRRD